MMPLKHINPRPLYNGAPTEFVGIQPSLWEGPPQQPNFRQPFHHAGPRLLQDPRTLHRSDCEDQQAHPWLVQTTEKGYLWTVYQYQTHEPEQTIS